MPAKKSKKTGADLAQHKKFESEINKLKQSLQAAEKKVKSTEQAWKTKWDKLVNEAQQKIIAAELSGFNFGLAHGRKISTEKEKAMRQTGAQVEKTLAKQLKMLKEKKTVEAKKKADALKKQANAQQAKAVKAKATKAKPKTKKSSRARVAARGPVSAQPRPQRSQPVHTPQHDTAQIAVGSTAPSKAHSSPSQHQSQNQNPGTDSGHNQGGFGHNH